MKKLIIILCLLLLSNFSTNARDQVNLIQEGELDYINAVAWSHDGTKIAAAGIGREGKQGYLRIINSQSGEILYHLDPNPGGFASIDWSPDDRFIAVGGYDQVVWVIDVKAQKQVAALYGHQSTVNAIHWNKNGTQLVSAGNWDGLVIVWDMVTYKSINKLQFGDVWSAAYSPDNQKIAVGGAGLSIYTSLLNADTSKIQRNFNTLSIAALAWSPDGSRIVFGTQTFPNIIRATKEKFGQLYVIDSRSGSVINQVYTDDTTLYGVDWSSDGDLIATYSIDGFIKVWDANTLTLLQTFNGTTRYPAHIHFSPYGGRLAYGNTVPENLVNSDIEVQTNADGMTQLAYGAVQIVVPAPSLRRLESISGICGIQPDMQKSLVAKISTNDLQGFTAQVSTLTDAQIPPGCKADLLAVAGALMGKSQ